MTIIGHRGAAGLAPENTLTSIKKALRYNIDMVEFDIRATKDNCLVLIHDPNLWRTAGIQSLVKNMNFKEIQACKTKSGDPIPSLEQALKVMGKTPVFLDCKGDRWSKQVTKYFQTHKGPQPIITSTNIPELEDFHKRMPEIQTFICEYINPFRALYEARKYGFTGVSMSYWLLNPAVYWHARRTGLELKVFTVNHIFVARFIHFFYPKVSLVTNFPNKLMTAKKATKA